jgi:galactitol-specific phosphotransferase system IIC component
MDGDKVLPIGGLVAVGIGVAAIVVVALTTVLVL